MTDPGVVVVFPEYFDLYEAEIVAKGYFADLAVAANGRTYRPVFYDPSRFIQEVRDHLDGGGTCYAEVNLVLVATVDRSHIEAAIAWLARHKFSGLIAQEE